MRIATYTRISTDEAHQPYSLSAQADRLASYIASQDGWTKEREFSDQMSGATMERPGLRRALAEASAGRFDLLLVYRVDRLSRSVRGLAHILEQLDSYGVAFRSATEPFDTATPAGRMMVQMLGVFAEFERATIIDRVIAGMERKAANGGWCGGQRPFGYVIDRAQDCLAVHEDEGPLVPIIFRMYVDDCLGARSIAMELNERGHRTRQGRPWSHTSVLTVLRNRAYVGEINFRGKHHPAKHAPLVDSETFARAQRLLVERGEDHARRSSIHSTYLLSGLVVCAQCGKRFVGSAATGRNARYPYYTCFSRQRYGVKACDSERLPAEELDRAVITALSETYAQHEIIEEALTRALAGADSQQARLEAELAALDADIRKTEQAIDRYLTAFEAGTMPEAECGPRIKGLADKLGALRIRRSELTEAITSPAKTIDLVHVDELRTSLDTVLIDGNAEQTRTVLRALIHEIRVENRKQVYPVFRVPADPVRTLAGVAVPTGFEPVSPP